MDPSQPPLISETLLKRRRSLDELAYRRSVHAEKSKKTRVLRGDLVKVKRPEQIVKEFLTRETSQNRSNRKRRKVEKESSAKVAKVIVKNSVGLVIRISDGKNIAGSLKGQLRELRLNNKYEAKFVKLDEDALRKFKPLDDYITYGYISKRSVVELVNRRAFTNAKGSRQPLSDNLTVETLLGNKGILCLSDMSDMIFSVGSHFDDATSILCPFKLSAPLGTYESKVLRNKDEVEQKGGFIGDDMDSFLNKIL